MNLLKEIRSWSAREVVDQLKADTLLAKARLEFYKGAAAIDQAQRQRTPLSPVEARRMEFEAVAKILKVYQDAGLLLELPDNEI